MTARAKVFLAPVSHLVLLAALTGCAPDPGGDPRAEADACPAGTAPARRKTQMIGLVDVGEERICKPCEAGEYCAGLGTRSVRCADATYDDDGDPATPCVAKTTCAPGSYATSVGSRVEDRECATCPAGTYTDADNLRACAACTPGSYCPRGSSRDDACVGDVWDHDGDPRTPCRPRTACPPGSEDTTGIDPIRDAVCVACAPGTYDDGTRHCVFDPGCPAGSVPVAPATPTSPTQCEACAPGEFCGGGGTARTTCDAGTWDHDGRPATPCVAWSACSPGEYVDPATASTTQDQCRVCPLGTYSDTSMASACAAQPTCPAGTYVRAPASAASARACAACPEGTSNASSNAATCGHVRALDADGNRTCALLDDGRVLCWGDVERSTPVEVPGLTSAVAIAVGWHHACALTDERHVVCWGDGSKLQLGDGAVASREGPVVVPGVEDVIAIAAGADATFALRSDGEVLTWGTFRDDSGWSEDRLVAVPAQLGPVGGASALAADDGLVWAVRGSVVRRLHVESGRTDDIAIPSVVVPGADCAATAGGGALCWTLKAYSVIESRALDLTDVTALAHGWRHDCFVARQQVICMGWNDDGQLGDGTTRDRWSLVRAGDLEDVVSVAAGDSHTCALRADGAVFCWGANDLGQLGDGTSVFRLVPTRVMGP